MASGREHRDVGAGPHRYVHVGGRGGFGAPRIEHPHLAARGAVLAQVADRIRERGAVAVRDDRVGPDEDRQTGNGRIPHRVEHRLAAHEFRRDQDGRIVDGHRGEERAATDRWEPLRRRDLTGRVVGETGGEVERDRIRSARVDDSAELGGEVVQELVPRRVAAVDARAVEPAG